jgi:hypothetical protein
MMTRLTKRSQRTSHPALTLIEGNPHLQKAKHHVLPNGRHLRHRETEFSVTNEPGRFRFLYWTVNTMTGDEWVDAIGPIGKQTRKFRAFAPTRIKRVHNNASEER